MTDTAIPKAEPSAVVLSGPAANSSQTKNAVAGLGFTIDKSDHNWGLPECPLQQWTGERDKHGTPVPGTGEWQPDNPEYPTAFVTVHCSSREIDRVIKAAKQYGYVVRATWPLSAVKPVVNPALEVAGPNYEQRIAELEARLAAVEGAK